MTKILTGPIEVQGSAVDGAQPASGRSVGFARVSTKGQTTAPQEAELRAAGCQLVFAERISTRVAEADRPQLQACLAELRSGDELVVVKLDRLGRTQREVIERLARLSDQGIHVRTLDGLLNTKALGKMAPLVVGLLTGLAEVERSLIRERTLASVEHRKANGGDLGGRPASYTSEQADLVQRLAREGQSVASIARAVGLSETTTRRLAKAGKEVS